MESNINDTGTNFDVVKNNSTNEGDPLMETIQKESPSDDSACDCDYTDSASVSRDQVFSNALIWRKLERCLNFTDMKCLRLVCREFNFNILQESSFKSRVVIDMKAFRVEQEVFRPTTLWKSFKIECFSEQDLYEDLSDGEVNNDSADSASSSVDFSQGEREDEHSPNLDWIYEVLKTAESLSIITICDFDVEGTILPPLKGLLEAPENLKSLSLDVQTLERNYENVFKNLSHKICKMFENITEFYILPSVRFMESLYDEVVNFTNAITILSTVMQNLRVFTVPKFVISGNDSGILVILKIIGENKAHLSTLEVAEPHFWSAVLSLESLNSNPIVDKTKISQFKSLKMVFHNVESDKTNEKIAAFLKTQPLLEKLEISSSPIFSPDLCSLICTLSNLKILRIRTKGFRNQQLFSWSCLAKLESLEEFYFGLAKSNSVPCYGINVGTILASLPKSVNKITVKGIPNGNGPNGDTNFELPFSIENGPAKINALNITYLNLRNCSAFVTDGVMHRICLNLHMLRTLDVSQNPRLTDYGFIGSCEDGLNMSTFYIKNLKGLRCLKLERCKITDLTVVHGIQFLELIHLDLTGCSSITNEGYMAAVQNNPSLETLKINGTLSSEFLAKFSRLLPIVKPTNEVLLSDEDDLSDSDASIDDFDDYNGHDSEDYDGLDDSDDNFDFNFRVGYYDNYMNGDLDFDEW